MATNMRAHEAGTLHADGYGIMPNWLPEPDDLSELMPQLWARNTSRDESGALTVAGVPVTDIARDFGTAAYVLDEDDFRARAGGFRDAFADFDVFYAGKAFLCTTVVRWLAEDGLSLDVCSGGELAVAEPAVPGDEIC